MLILLFFFKHHTLLKMTMPVTVCMRTMCRLFVTGVNYFTVMYIHLNYCTKRILVEFVGDSHV